MPNPISGFSPISCPIWPRYRKNIAIYRYQGRCRIRCVCKYRNILISCTSDLGAVSRYRGRCITWRASAPHRPHWPLPRRSNRSSLLVLRPPRLSLHRGDTPDTLPGCLTHLTPRNVHFYRPTSREKGGGDASGMCVMAVAADKLRERHWLGHSCQIRNVT